MEQKMMKALVFQGIGKLGLEERPVPVIKEPTDAIVRVTRSTICTSDLHSQKRGGSKSQRRRDSGP